VANVRHFAVAYFLGAEIWGLFFYERQDKANLFRVLG
jgi:hypothetical protein